KIHQATPRLYKAKYVEEILDEYALLTERQLNFIKWISDYYMSPEGDVLKAALPGAFLLQSETVIELDKGQDPRIEELTDEEYLIYEALQRQAILKIQEVTEILDKKTVLPILNKMVEKGIIQVNQELFKKYAPKQVRYVQLAEAYDESRLQEIVEELSRAPKQRALMMGFFALNGEKKRVSFKALTKKADASSTTLQTLLDKGILTDYYIQEDRIETVGKSENKRLELTEDQSNVLKALKALFKQQKPGLLHGVTSSGKTAVYSKLIEETLATGRQVLYLLPEIALTTQLIERLQRRFGEEVLVYHSKYSVNERVEVYRHVLQNDKGKIIVGVRSSIFLPFQELGLIIVDESHETTFKQFDPAPRYQARDSAVVMAQLFFKCPIVLGTATP